jgi:hypothetical protein
MKRRGREEGSWGRGGRGGDKKFWEELMAYFS